MQIDYDYLCQGLGHLTGIETRIYQHDALIHRYSHYDFDPDIAGIIHHQIAENSENAFYIETEDLLIFGVIKSKIDQTTLIIGPTSQIRPDKQTAMTILYMLDQPYSRLTELQDYFYNIVPYPFETFLEILCFVNYAINNEKLAISQLIKSSDHISDSYQHNWDEHEEEHYNEPHNTYQAEKQMLSFVSSGNTEKIEAFFQSPPTGRVGAIAQTELRQRKNTFVCAATLISRAAIDGGMPSELAFALSDSYIQKSELLNAGGDIITLNMQMLLDYTKRVEALKYGAEGSRIAKDVTRYVLKNITKKISTQSIAAHLKVNRSYLCERFKADTGNTIGGFITHTKIEEAKRMLLLSDLSIAQISDYLAFSSQSYFQTVFKKTQGCTPVEYRTK
ncbi:MAG: helix-turn-helix domain-containing protein [Clostridiales bacterium]|nr:helix-turn-helix domain-containing protein [Clostridiales bacterium]